MEQHTVKELAKSLHLAFQLADIDPAKDTVVSAVDKFHDKGLRHLVFYVENGFFCICSDPEMSKKFRDAIKLIDEEMDREEVAAEQDLGKAS